MKVKATVRMNPTILLRSAGIVLVLLLAAKPAGADDTSLIGSWLHPNKAVEIAIAPCGDRLCGKIAWLQSPYDLFGEPLTDTKNPMPALRDRPLLGLTVLSDLRSTGERKWQDGKIYNPIDGKNYLVELSMGEDGTLEVFAYVFMPTIGKTETWTRAAHSAQFTEN